MAHQLEVGVTHKIDDVISGAAEKIIDAQDLVPISEKPLAKMGTQKSRTASNEDFFPVRYSH